MIKRLIAAGLFLLSSSALAVVFLQSDGGGGGGSLTLTELIFHENSNTTGSFTPSDSSLVMVIAGGTKHDAGSISISDSESLTWTLQANHLNANWQATNYIWTTEIVTGVSMTVTTNNFNASNTKIQIVEITGYDTTTPVNLTHSDGAGNNTRTGAYSGSLGGTSASDSMVIGVFSGVSGVDDLDTGSGWTEIVENSDGTNTSHFSYIEGAVSNFDLAEAAVNSGWAGWAATAVEVQAAP